jgi:hypothetical protein
MKLSIRRVLATALVLVLSIAAGKEFLHFFSNASATTVSMYQLGELLTIARRAPAGVIGVWEWEGLMQLSYECREGKYLINYGKGVRGIWIGQESGGHSVEVFDSNLDGLVDRVYDPNPDTNRSFNAAEASVMSFLRDLPNQQYGQQIYVDAVSCLQSTLQTTRAAR